jgi:two-component system chemotaxis response regulator CheY/two-component system phosphate regulon response regulator PhoB
MNVKKAIIAEDQVSMQSLIRITLNAFGITDVIKVTNGIEVIDILKNDDQYGIIILDWNMPQMDGLECCKHIRSGITANINKKIPIILLTSNTGNTNKEIAYNAGVDFFLEKPFSMRDLHDSISLVLNTTSVF